MRLEDAGFKLRTENALMYAGIKNIEELKNMTAQQIMAFRYVGIFVLRDIRKVLASHGMYLKGDHLCNSEEQKKLIESIPDFIKQIQNSMLEIERNIKNLVYQLDQIHIVQNSELPERFNKD